MGKGKALHGNGHIFQRDAGGGNLRVGDPRIDNHKVVLLDGVLLLLHQKASRAVLYIEELGKGMDMRLAVPVVFISGVGDGKEPAVRIRCRSLFKWINRRSQIVPPEIEFIGCPTIRCSTFLKFC